MDLHSPYVIWEYFFDLLYSSLDIIAHSEILLIHHTMRTNGVRLVPVLWGYPLVGRTRERHFTGTKPETRKLPKNAATPTSLSLPATRYGWCTSKGRVHAALGAFCLENVQPNG